MTLSHRAFRSASTILQGSGGFFSLKVPAGKAACNSVVLRLDAIGGDGPNVVAASPSSNKYLVGMKAIVKNLVLRVGSARFPAREISDFYGNPQNLPAQWANNVTNPAAAENATVGGFTYINTSDTRAAEMYKEGRGFFSLFDNDKYDSSPAAPLFDGTLGASCPTAKMRLGATAAIQVAGTNSTYPTSQYQYAATGPVVTDAINGLDSTGTFQESPNIFIFNLQSLMPEMSLRERGYALTSVDLRNQCDVTIEGEILGTAPLGTNLAPAGTVTWPSASSWQIDAAMEYSEMVTCLPGRTDLEASSSLISSAAGAVASGGGASGI
jgi:hypothetical protein